MKKYKIYIFYYFLGELLFLCKIPETFKFPNFFWNMKISCVHDVFDSFSQNDKITMYLLSFGMIIFSQTGKLQDINLYTL